MCSPGNFEVSYMGTSLSKLLLPSYSQYDLSLSPYRFILMSNLPDAKIDNKCISRECFIQHVSSWWKVESILDLYLKAVEGVNSRKFEGSSLACWQFRYLFQPNFHYTYFKLYVEFNYWHIMGFFFVEYNIPFLPVELANIVQQNFSLGEKYFASTLMLYVLQYVHTINSKSFRNWKSPCRWTRNKRFNAVLLLLLLLLLLCAYRAFAFAFFIIYLYQQMHVVQIINNKQ